MVFASHASQTQCSNGCVCGADLTNAVAQCRDEIEQADKQLIELRNSGVAEDVIQDAQAARHTAQERYDAAFQAFIDFSNQKPMRIADVDDEEAVATDDESSDDEDNDDEGDAAGPVVKGKIEAHVGPDEDDEDDEDYRLSDES